MTQLVSSIVAPGTASRVRVEGHELRALSAGWETAAAPADREFDAAQLDDLTWIPARVPGTAAGALREAGLWHTGDARDFDSDDWWFRASFDAEPPMPGEEVDLRLDGIATVAEVYLNGELVLASDSMFAPHAVDVSERLQSSNEIAIRCRALGPLLRPRRRPRARWHTRLVPESNLRFFRTMLIGRAPGFAPGPAAVGPWRPVCLERRRRVSIDELRLRPRLEGDQGVLSVAGRIRRLDGERPGSAEIELVGPSGAHRGQLELGEGADELGGVGFGGELRIPDVALWWPHTHGEPIMHDVRLHLDVGSGTIAVGAGRVGFRDLTFGPGEPHDVERDGIALEVNGVGVFARGAVWTPIDSVGLAPAESEVRAALERVRAAGMNMLRLAGTGAYETSTFHDLCDELGILVWQDFMFANFDYPIAEEAFRDAVAREAAAVLEALGGRPSLAVICGNSEIDQQVAMLGLDPSLGRGELFGELLPGLVRDSGVDAVYVPSAPCGGALPFRPEAGVANYYGVGGYLRPLEDARRAGVRFAAECLAFSNVPDEESIEQILPRGSGDLIVDHPVWKAAVPRDRGAGWDFEDVRDHYLRLLYDVDPSELRRVDHDRYLELSRAVTGEVMTAVFGEWRRGGSTCGGGLVLWLQDVLPGAGWGLIDSRGEPKVVFRHLARALAPIAVWMTDEGLGGVRAHVANDHSAALTVKLRIALYRGFEQSVGGGEETLELDPHGYRERDVEAIIGHFVDASWAYRFGPPAQHVIVASLEADEHTVPQLLSQSFYFPAGRPTSPQSADQLGLEVGAERLDDRRVRLSIASRRLAWGVRAHVPGFIADDDALSIEPGTTRMITLRPRFCDDSCEGGWLTALNLDGRLRFRVAGGIGEGPLDE